MIEELAQNHIGNRIAAEADLDVEGDHAFIGELTVRVLAALGRRAVANGSLMVGDISEVIQQYAVRPAEIRRKARRECGESMREMLESGG